MMRTALAESKYDETRQQGEIAVKYMGRDTEITETLE